MLVDGYDPATNEYYLERNTRLADHIMDFFATGKRILKNIEDIEDLIFSGSLHKPTNICTERFKEELDFWRIGVEYVSREIYNSIYRPLNSNLFCLKSGYFF